MAINRYAVGMSYGFHYDLHLQRSAEGITVRADLSATLFLTPPEEYEGGELQVIQDGYTNSVKGKAGELMLYPAGALHQVNPITKGERYAVIFWVQSMIRDVTQRSLLFDLDMAIIRLNNDHPGHQSIVELTAVYHNLLRQWSEV